MAPPWQMPDEAEELRACMRYWRYQRLQDRFGTPGNFLQKVVDFEVAMRIAPACSFTDLVGNANCATGDGTHGHAMASGGFSTVSSSNFVIFDPVTITNPIGSFAWAIGATFNARM